jgi:hypothetical protein
MFQNIQKFIWMAAGSFVLIILLSITGELLKKYSNIPVEKIESEYAHYMIMIPLILFFVLIVAVVPLFLRIFTYLQTSIGNGALAMVKFIRTHERIITYVVWIIMFIVSLIIVPTAIKDWLE